MGLLGILVTAAVAVGYRTLSTTTVVLVRHAEKELSTIDDPPLAPDGELRAERLSLMFGKVSGIGRLKAIYVSDTRRSQQTAAPLATRLHLDPIVVPANDIAGLAERAMQDHRGGAVLIVGHSNTVPEIIKRISGLKVAPIADDEFNNIYVVSVPTLGKASLIRLEY